MPTINRNVPDSNVAGAINGISLSTRFSSLKYCYLVKVYNFSNVLCMGQNALLKPAQRSLAVWGI